jgi:hypothetical protein
LTVDGAVRAVAAGAPDLAAQDGDEGGFVELKDELGSRYAPSDLGEVLAQALGE